MVWQTNQGRKEHLFMQAILMYEAAEDNQETIADY
jgi:hypothetical protein